jgi:hypothetical protein
VRITPSEIFFVLATLFHSSLLSSSIPFDKMHSVLASTVLASMTDLLKCLPEHPAEVADYEDWGKRFAKLWVRRLSFCF